MNIRLNATIFLLLLCCLFSSCKELPKQGKAESRPNISDMVLIPDGEFIMGKEDEMAGHNHGEHHDHHAHHKHKDVDFGKPAHKVFLNAYYIDKYEVTNSKFYKFIKDGGYEKRDLWTDDGWNWKEKNSITAPNWWNNGESSNYKGSIHYPENPITGISWYEADAYARWAGKSLPTEAQWEKAARGDKPGYIYPWGDEDPNCTYANFCIEKHDFCFGSTAPVGSYKEGVSPHGLYDMSGNVWEWCKDWHNPDFYANSPYENPECTKPGTRKIMRGGAWLNEKSFINSTFRQKAKPELRNYFTGFRCVINTK